MNAATTTQCSETTVAPNAGRIQRGGVEMQIGRRSVQCPQAAQVVVTLLGQERGYCTSHGQKRQALAAALAAI